MAGRAAPANASSGPYRIGDEIWTARDSRLLASALQVYAIQRAADHEGSDTHQRRRCSGSTAAPTARRACRQTHTMAAPSCVPTPFRTDVDERLGHALLGRRHRRVAGLVAGAEQRAAYRSFRRPRDAATSTPGTTSARKLPPASVAGSVRIVLPRPNLSRNIFDPRTASRSSAARHRCGRTRKLAAGCRPAPPGFRGVDLEHVIQQGRADRSQQHHGAERQQQ